MEGEGGETVAVERAKSGEQLGMAEEKPPDWLPDGWIMEVKTTKKGAKHRYYISPESGCKFRSRRDVLHYLSIVKVDGHVSETTSCSRDKKQKIVAHAKNSPEWLPAGWILEIKTRRSGVRAGEKYKCYFDPLTGSRFYSKGDVFRFLSSGKICTTTAEQKRRSNATDNVLAQIQYSPDGLPHGWVKEVKFRKSKTNGVRKDPYYTDPVSGYVFRSLKNALHYVETGEVSKNAYVPRKGNIRDNYALEQESPPPISARELKSQGTIVRRCLFAGETSNSNVEMEMEIGIEGAISTHLTPNSKHIEGEAKKKRKMGSEAANENIVRHAKQTTGKKRGRPAKKQRGKKGRGEVLEPEKLSKRQSEPSGKIPPDLWESKQLELAGEEEPTQVTNKKAQVSIGMTHELIKIEKLDEENGIHLELTNDKPPVEDSKLLERGNEKTSLPGEEEPQPNRGDKRHGSSKKTNARKIISVPCRASKRLAGFEAVPVSDLSLGRQRRRSISNVGEGVTKKTVPSSQPKSMEHFGEKAALGDQAVMIGELTEDMIGSSLELPFGDSWPDPCIEFAFKTLTGDIPLFEDGIAIEDYFQQQILSVESLSSSGSALLASGNPDGLDQAKVPTELEKPKEHHLQVNGEQQILSVESSSPSGSALLASGNPDGLNQAKLPNKPEKPKEHHLLVNGERLPSPVENGQPSRGKVIKQQRRSPRLNC